MSAFISDQMLGSFKQNFFAMAVGKAGFDAFFTVNSFHDHGLMLFIRNDHGKFHGFGFAAVNACLNGSVSGHQADDDIRSEFIADLFERYLLHIDERNA